MLTKKKLIIMLSFMLLVFTFAVPAANAKPSEYKMLVKHLKTKYKAKKVRIPMLWLARFAVSVVRPAGVKSFSVTLFEDLKFSRETLDEEMQSAMKNSFSEDWSPILRVRSKTGEQVYMYMREAGSSVRLTVVTIDKQQAAIIRATFNPDKLAEFMNDPKIFGISLNDGDEKKSPSVTITEEKKETELEKKAEEAKKDN